MFAPVFTASQRPVCSSHDYDTEETEEETEDYFAILKKGAEPSTPEYNFEQFMLDINQAKEEPEEQEELPLKKEEEIVVPEPEPEPEPEPVKKEEIGTRDPPEPPKPKRRRTVAKIPAVVLENE